MQAVEGIYPIIGKANKIVITTHQKPDGDAMGSSLALFHFLKALGNDVKVISPTNWAAFLNWLPGCKEVIDYEANKEKATTLLKEADILFCLDFNVLHRTKNLEPVLEKLNCIKVLIDHHQQPQETYFDFGISNVNKSSTAEMIYDFITQSPYADKINMEMATCLYTGIMTDTGSFRFASTTPSVHRVVAHLKELEFDHTNVHDKIFDHFSENRLRFTGNALLNRLEVFYEYNTAMMAIPRKDLLKYDIKTGDTEGLVNYLLTIDGIKLGALVIDRDEERKWSFRSKGDFDVNQLARLYFEGGGHVNAAGGRSSDSLEETVKKFKQVLKQYETQLQ